MAVSLRESRRPSLLTGMPFSPDFFKNFYNTDVLLGKRVSEQAVQASWNIAAGASAAASLACVATWHEDFPKI